MTDDEVLQRAARTARFWWLVDMIPYSCLQAVSDATGMKRSSLQHRFQSAHFPNYIGPLSEIQVTAAIVACARLRRVRKGGK